MERHRAKGTALLPDISQPTGAGFLVTARRDHERARRDGTERYETARLEIVRTARGRGRRR